MKNKQDGSATSKSPQAKTQSPTPLELLEFAKLLNLDLSTADVSYEQWEVMSAREKVIQERHRVLFLRRKLQVAIGVWDIAQEVIRDGAPEFRQEMTREEQEEVTSRLSRSGWEMPADEAMTYLGVKTLRGLSKAISAAGLVHTVAMERGMYTVDLLDKVKAKRDEERKRQNAEAKRRARKAADQAKS